MKNKKWLLLLIIAFPSTFWLLLESSTINSRKLPFFGPKKAISKGDTSYHKFPYPSDNMPSIYAIAFLAENYRQDAYRLTGVYEYLKYKEEKIRHLPVMLITESDSLGKNKARELDALSEHKNVRIISLPRSQFLKQRRSLFVQKPYYVDSSYFALIDMNRNVRGFYDARYVAEIKRLIDEHQHLRIQEAKDKIIKENEIETRNP